MSGTECNLIWEIHISVDYPLNPFYEIYLILPVFYTLQNIQIDDFNVFT